MLRGAGDHPTLKKRRSDVATIANRVKWKAAEKVQGHSVKKGTVALLAERWRRKSKHQTRLEFLFGPELSTADTKQPEKVPTANLQDTEAVAILAIASWHSDSTLVREQVVLLYDMLQQADKMLHVVVMSFDVLENEYKKMLDRMPSSWFTLGFQCPRRNLICSFLDIQGQPSFTILTPHGHKITADGIPLLKQDPFGEGFPWLPPTLHDVLGPTVSNSKYDTVNTTELFDTLDKNNKGLPCLGFFFGACWSKPCKAFSITLKRAWQGLQDSFLRAHTFNLVYASADTDSDMYNDFIKNADMLTLGFQNGRVQQLAELFDVKSMPCVVVVDAEGNVLNPNAVDAIVASDPSSYEIDDFPWIQHPFSFLQPFLINGHGENVTVQKLAEDFFFFVVFYGAKGDKHSLALQKKLKTGFETLKAARMGKTRENKFTVIYVSADENDSDFHDMLSAVPEWVAFPRDFAGHSRKSRFARSLGLHKLPSMFVLSNTGEVISTIGVEMVEYEDPEFMHFPWVLEFAHDQDPLPDY